MTQLTKQCDRSRGIGNMKTHLDECGEEPACRPYVSCARCAHNANLPGTGLRWDNDSDSAIREARTPGTLLSVGC
jgi:hypothetical protein